MTQQNVGRLEVAMCQAVALQGRQQSADRSDDISFDRDTSFRCQVGEQAERNLIEIDEALEELRARGFELERFLDKVPGRLDGSS